MSASSSIVSAVGSTSKAIDLADLENLIAQIKLVNAKYENKGFLSFKAHAGALENIATHATTTLKSINDEYLTRIATSTTEADKTMTERKMAEKTQLAYMEIVRELEEKFNTGFQKWEKDNKAYITDNMHEATRYDMYNCAHLNASKPSAHSSSRNIGLLLQWVYIRLGDQEKIKRMQNLKSNKDSILSTAAPQQEKPAPLIVNQHDLNFTIGQLQSILAEYKKKRMGSSKEHEKHIAEILDFAEKKVFSINASETQLSTNPSMTHDQRVAALRPQVTSAFNEIVNALQSQFDSGIQKWGDKNTTIFRNEMSLTTKSDMFNCLYLNADIDGHSATRNIGILLQSLYGKVADKERMDCMKNLKSDVENRSPSPTRKI